MRCVEQLTSAPKAPEVVVAAERDVPGLAGGGVRLLRASRSDWLDVLVDHECQRARDVLILPSTTLLGPDWSSSVEERLAEVPHHVSSVRGAHRGVELFPSSVSAPGAGRTIWRPRRGITPLAPQAPHAMLTISAIVVTDGAATLDATLASLRGIVDETLVVAVSDPGEAAAAAARHSAVVVDVPWREHFSDARNAAAGSASGDWVLHVSQGDVVSAPPDELRAVLSGTPAALGAVRCFSPGERWDCDAFPRWETRLARRRLGLCVGAYREQLRGASVADDARGVVSAPLTITRDTPPGAAHSVFAGLRNVSIAERELATCDEEDPRRPVLVAFLGEALWHARKPEQALLALEVLKDEVPGPPELVAAGRLAVKLLDADWRYAETHHWFELLLSWGEAPGNVAVARARQHLSMPRADDAWRAIRPFVDGEDRGVDPWGRPCSQNDVDAVHVEVLLQQGDGRAAVSLLRAMMSRDPRGVRVDHVIDAHRLAGAPAASFLMEAPEALLSHSLEVLGHSPWRTALHWCEAHVLAHPRDLRPIFAGNEVAAEGGWRHAVVWAARAHSAGLGDHCALRRLATNSTAPPVDRAIAGTLLHELFGSSAADPSVQEACMHLTASEQVHASQVVAELTGSAGPSIFPFARGVQGS